VIDPEVVFFDNFVKIWSYQGDVEFANNNDTIVDCAEIGPTDYIRPNVGTMRIAPTPASRRFLESVLEYTLRLIRGRHVDIFLRRTEVMRNNGLYELQFGKRTLSFSFVDPWKAPNGGVLFCRGKRLLCVKVRGALLARPVAVHLNYHWSINSIIATMRALDVFIDASEFANSSVTCRKNEWKYWRECTLPETIVCNGTRVSIPSDYDAY
jgi:hypothetical protein